MRRTSTIGKNIGAELPGRLSRFEADRRIAQAKAAERQYAAQAAEQEQKAETQAMRAKVVEAEASIPQAIAEAVSQLANLGVMDYYRLKNIQADTGDAFLDRCFSTEAETDALQPPIPSQPSK